MQGADQHLALLHGGIDTRCILDPDQDEIGVAGETDHVRTLRQPAVQATAFGQNALGLLHQHCMVRQHHLAGGLVQHPDVIGWTHLVEFGNPVRMRRGIAQTDTRQTKLGDSTHHHQVGKLVQPLQKTGAGKYLIGLVHHHQSGRSPNDAGDGLGVIQIAAGVVGVSDKHNCRTVLAHRRQRGRFVQGKIRLEINPDKVHPCMPRADAIHHE